MKQFNIVLVVLLACLNGHAQTRDEWFNQKKTQKEYLTQQIAALRVYSDYLKKGYNIARTGLNTVENIKNGNFHLDATFLDSHKRVNPAISTSVKVANIIGYEAMSIRDFRRLHVWCAQDGSFTPEELLYLTHVYANLIRACDSAILELRTISQSSELAMTDDERLDRLDAAYQDSQDRYSFVKAFDNE